MAIRRCLSATTRGSGQCGKPADRYRDSAWLRRTWRYVTGPSDHVTRLLGFRPLAVSISRTLRSFKGFWVTPEARTALGLSATPLTVLHCVAALAAAGVSYWLIERPALRQKGRFRSVRSPLVPPGRRPENKDMKRQRHATVRLRFGLTCLPSRNAEEPSRKLTVRSRAWKMCYISD